MSILGVLGVVFIVLKLTGLIAWSWWLVLLPLYGGIAFVLVCGLMAFAGVGVLTLFSKSARK